jgi:hypothetical protein
VDGGTRLQWTGEMQLTGLMRVFEPLIARSFGKSVERNFARLKQVLEHASPQPAQ